MDKFEYELKKQRGETINAAVVRLCKWIPITVICWFGYLSIASLAGRSTLASLGLYLVADLKVNKVLSHIAMFAFGVGGASYGYRQKRLMQRNIERMSPALEQREKQIDPNRSSSRLTSKGQTRPEDEI
jgi:hypothetical protein